MKRKIRIGLLTEKDQIPNWSFLMLQKILESGSAEIVVNVKKENTREESRSFLKKMTERRRNFLYSIYRKIDSKLFKPQPNAFLLKNIKDIVDCPVYPVKTKQTKFSDYVSDSDLKALEEFNVDVFIRMGFRILRGGILSLAKYGVWSYHHGDNTVNRGGPAGVWEVVNGWDLTGVVLQILTEDLDGGQILSSSYSSTDKTSVSRNRNNYYWKAMSLLPRKINELYEHGEKTFFERVSKENSYRYIYSNQLFLAPTNKEMLKFFPKVYWVKFINKLKSYIFFDQWILLYKFNKSSALSTSLFRFKRITPPKDRFWADPFLYEKEGKYFIFIEELVYKEKLGKISVMEMDSKGNWSDPTTVLKKDYHLSYPYLIEKEEGLFMIPETSKNSTIEMYKCVEFPYKWNLHKIMMKDVNAVDATILSSHESDCF